MVKSFSRIARVCSLLSVLLITLVTIASLLPVTYARATTFAQAGSPFTIYLPSLFKPANLGTDSGFRPEKDGFSFENYGGGTGYVNLTAAEVYRLFGSSVCASTPVDGSCTLTPAGEQWLQQQNEGMNGGHCEGFAVLSLLLYDKKLNPQSFGASTVPELIVQGNEKLQREIAYWFITQATRPANDAIVKGTPVQIVDALRTSYQSGKLAEYAVGFYKRDRTGGHAVTPIAVEDRADGVAAILIYDNNYPKTTREILVNTTTNTWRYNGSTNPAEPADDYEGDAETKTLELAPIAPRIPQQQCPFCEGSGASTAQDATRYNEVYLDGNADLLITDQQTGKSIGYRNGQPVDEIGGAEARSNKYLVPVWNSAEEPVYTIPITVDFTISIDGTRLTTPTTSSVTMIGPGYTLDVNDITLDPGQSDTLDVNSNGTQLSYRTASGETPDLLLGFETPGADYSLVVKGFDLAANDAVNLSLDEAGGKLRIDASTEQAVAFDLLLQRDDANSTQVFGTGDDVSINPEDLLYVDYASWQGNGQPLTVEIDRGGDGSIDETITLVDATDLFEE